jgi:hypothetical protein
MEYKVVVGYSRELQDFNKQVNDLLAEGWSLYGEPKIAAYFANWENNEGEHADMIAQALTKTE